MLKIQNQVGANHVGTSQILNQTLKLNRNPQITLKVGPVAMH